MTKLFSKVYIFTTICLMIYNVMAYFLLSKTNNSNNGSIMCMVTAS